MTHKWYVVQAQSSFEHRVAQAIRESARKKGLEKHFDEIMVPSEQVVEMRRGRKIKTERKFFPGYVLVKMDLNDTTYHVVKSLPKVSGFLGSENRPSPISEAEAKQIAQQVHAGEERPRPAVTFDIGEVVRVTDGPFNSFSGTVEMIDDQKSRLKLELSILGRSTRVDIDFSQVEKI